MPHLQIMALTLMHGNTYLRKYLSYKPKTILTCTSLLDGQLMKPYPRLLQQSATYLNILTLLGTQS